MRALVLAGVGVGLSAAFAFSRFLRRLCSHVVGRLGPVYCASLNAGASEFHTSTKHCQEPPTLLKTETSLPFAPTSSKALCQVVGDVVRTSAKSCVGIARLFKVEQWHGPDDRIYGAVMKHAVVNGLLLRPDRTESSG